MRLSKVLFSVAALVLLTAWPTLADKAQEMSEQAAKPWSVFDLPEFQEAQADVNETEPLNNTCPGEPYLYGDVYHAGLTAGDQDWVTIFAGAGDLITLATDSEAGSTTDTYLELYRDDCTTLLAFNDDGGPGLFSLISNFPAPYTGAYYVKVRGFSATTSGLYKFVGTVVEAPETTCPIDGYKGLKYEVNQPIPDAVPAGITAGPIVFPPDGSTILDVVVDLGITHTWVGDLVVTLTHIGPCGTQSVRLVDRPGVPQSTFGCSGDLIGGTANKYYFGTGNLAAMGEQTCPAQIPLQCYAVAPENANGLLVFRNCPKDGEWFLNVSDNASLDVGTLINFSVHVLNDGPVSVESASWGSVKADYRE